MNIELKRQYISVRERGKGSYGGNQNWFVKGQLASYGCGLVAMGDILLYLDGKSEIISHKKYLHYLKGLHETYFYVPKITKGIFAPMLAAGFNLRAIEKKSGFRARWGVWPSNLKKSIEKMLSDDIPVLFSVGANFPKIWGKEGLCMYSKNENTGTFYQSQTVRRHYMVITGIEESPVYGKMLSVSSWGEHFYIVLDDYINYVRKQSNMFYSNILYIKEYRMKKEV